MQMFFRGNKKTEESKERDIEIGMMKELDSPYIIKYHERFEYNGATMVIMDFMEYGLGVGAFHWVVFCTFHFVLVVYFLLLHFRFSSRLHRPQLQISDGNHRKGCCLKKNNMF
jgi:hypothetical protein